MNTSATRRHWSFAHKQRRQWETWIVFGFKPGNKPREPLKFARVTVTRVTAASKYPDIDNLHYACKPIFDALVSRGILADDGPEVERVIRWERGKRRKPETRIKIEEIEVE
jgi:Holliday junction resolvase RusA-like endonuclease